MAHYDISEMANNIPLMGSFASMLEDSTREWQDELGEVPVEAIIWQPFPMGYSIGALLLHIIAVEKWWIHDCCGGIAFTDDDKKLLMWNETNVDDAIWPTPPSHPLDWYMGILKQTRAMTLTVLAGIKDDTRIYSRPTSGNQLTVRWMVAHTIEHDAYHGGQAVMLRTLWEKLGRPQF
jgi:uncharacterized damage-inducible protein DinB